MNFHILKLIIWPKIKTFAPQVVEFQPGMLNVITGSSRTGKSAIIPIIDYCLASGDCNIPIDTIRDHAEWYGIIFQSVDDQVLIARKVPVGNLVSNDFYFDHSANVSIPPLIIDGNEKTDGIKHILNTMSSVPYFSLDGDEEKRAYTARLSFRDLMALVFQTQDIVANQNILFYKTHAHEHRERLRNWFPFILGAENIDVLIARQRIQIIEKRLNQLRREFDKSKTVSASWMANMKGHLKIAKEYGLLENELIDDEQPEKLLTLAKELLANIPGHSLTESKNIDTANREVQFLEVQEEKISAQIGTIKKRLNDLRKLKGGLVDYGDSVRKRVDRLQISKWLTDISAESENCPACGSKEHPNSSLEILKISNAFQRFESESKIVAEVPTSFSREEERLKQELDRLIEEKKSYQKRFDYLIAGDVKIQVEFQQRKNMFLFLGHMRASMETFESLVDGGDLKLEIDLLELEYKNLQSLVDQQNVQRRIDASTARISQGILNHLKTLDVESKYQQVAPRFNIKDLNISVLSNDNHWHFLAQVGSASNWVSFHLALMCSLQEYFLSLNNSCIPSFVIFDQPSQVYFPKLKRNEIQDELDPQYQDEDVEAVKSMFKTISDSIKKTNGKWQGIILDHADDNIYGEIDGVFEVDVWRNGKKLIPEEWYL